VFSDNDAFAAPGEESCADISDVTILLDGETETGKQILAHAIHKLDEKRGGLALITVHCSTITEPLAESVGHWD
jgi:transcriptional regulator with GAF, ATPase, and Fis domain